MHRRNLLLSVLLAGVLLGTFLWGTDWGALWEAFRRASWVSLALGLLAGAGIYVTRGLRWAFLLAPLGRVRWTDAVWANVIGFAANTVLPGRVGEVVRALWIRRMYDIPLAHLLATIALERVVDLGVLASLLGFFFLKAPDLGWIPPAPPETWDLVVGLVRTSVLLLGFLVLLVVLMVLWARWRPFDSGGAWAGAPQWLAFIVRFFHDVAQGFRLTSRPTRLIPYVFISVIFWGLDAGAIWLGVWPFIPDFPLHGSLWVMALVMLGAAIPTPGAVGGFHWGVRISLTGFYNIDPTTAVSAGVWSHFCAFFPAVGLAVAYLAVRGLTWHHVREVLRPAVERREVSPLSE
ncbi:MAG: flippase-like domain-containing protein [Acidobacteria bacterium]|nr:flippase-like domain-containing protein [Acidobacteriota bacterium]MDW7983815.1 lysylphosphatidylglycerol synthase transmembrane domain-containing protein [Acidobacteriota bacterium]